MKRKNHIIIFAVLLLTFLLIILTPLSYTSFNYSFIHFWIVMIYAIYILLSFTKANKFKSEYRIGTFTILPIIAIISAYVYIVTPNNVKIINVPNSNLKITYNFYSLFMMGNPRIDASIGHTFIGDALIWELNNYHNEGGESLSDLEQYIIPRKIVDGESMILFHEEGYLYDGNKILRISKKNN